MNISEAVLSLANISDNRFHSRLMPTVNLNNMVGVRTPRLRSLKKSNSLPYITEQKMDGCTHNKTIQNDIESYSFTDEQMTYLKKYRL